MINAEFNTFTNKYGRKGYEVAADGYETIISTCDNESADFIEHFIGFKGTEVIDNQLRINYEYEVNYDGETTEDYFLLDPSEED